MRECWCAKGFFAWPKRAATGAYSPMLALPSTFILTSPAWVQFPATLIPEHTRDSIVIYAYIYTHMI